MRKSLIIFLIVCCSCNNNRRSADQDHLAKFDSINRVLRQTQTLVNLETDSAYQAMVDRLPDEQGGVRQFYYHVHDFYGYVANLRWQFYVATGDTAGEGIQPGQEFNKDITNRFFSDEKNTSRMLITSLRFTFEQLRKQAKDDTILRGIVNYENALLREMQTGAEFNAVYFRNTDPQTVIIILNSIEQQIRIFELQILNKYFNNYINELKEKILGDRNSDRDTLPQ